MDSRAVLAAAVLLVTALAGCAETGEGGPIKIVSRPGDPLTEPLVAEATMSADSYEWDMGDGRPKLEGKRVEHVYGVTGGAFTIRLTTVSGGEATTHQPLRVELGELANQAPSFELAVEWQWVSVGENVTLSGAGSQDPDGDTLLFSWMCQPKGEIAVAGAGHGHPAGGGVPYGSVNANAIPLRLLNGTDVPSADHQVDDLCEGLPTGFQSGDTVRGSFAKAGLYEVTMLAKDPGHPAVAGSVMMYVTDGPRQVAVESFPLTGTLQYGAPATADDVLRALEQDAHLAVHAFTIRYPTLGVKFSLSHDDGAGVPVEMGYAIHRGSTQKVGETSEDTLKGAGDLTPGAYVATVALRQGADVEYTLAVEITYQTDPTMIFEGPH